jgi:uncharacterized membrane protein
MVSLIVVIVVGFLVLLLLKVNVALIALPLCVLALFLIVTTDDDVKRLAYFMIGTGLLLTIVVELVYLVGDIGRMNIVFKLYHQAWMLLTLPMGLAAATLWRDLYLWRTRSQIAFQVAFIVLFFIALLFPVLATKDKITDRMDPNAPQTLDGMKYMETSQFAVNGIVMNLGRIIGLSNGCRKTCRVHRSYWKPRHMNTIGVIAIPFTQVCRGWWVGITINASNGQYYAITLSRNEWTRSMLFT